MHKNEHMSYDCHQFKKMACTDTDHKLFPRASNVTFTCTLLLLKIQNMNVHASNTLSQAFCCYLLALLCLQLIVDKSLVPDADIEKCNPVHAPISATTPNY